jgi:hypothetical protein
MNESNNAVRENTLTHGTEMYEQARVVITPEGPHHYTVTVSENQDHHVEHAVERVVVNTATITLEDPVWFVDADVDVGVPLSGPVETVWVWP